MSKFLVSIASAALLLASCRAQDGDQGRARPESQIATATLEVGCATCVFEMAGVEGCLLAVKVDDEPYLVSGVAMPGHESGLCDHSRMAELTGRLHGERFVATSFTLEP